MKSQKGRKDRAIGPDFHVLLLAGNGVRTKKALVILQSIQFYFIFILVLFSVSVRGRIWEEKGCEYRTTKARMVAEVLGVDSSWEARSPPKDCAAQVCLFVCWVNKTRVCLFVCLFVWIKTRKSILRSLCLEGSNNHWE